MAAAAPAEAVLTAGFLLVILGATSRWAAAGFAPLAIGMALTLIHLISIPVTNTSVNPARSTGVALFSGDWALGRLWLFWLAPIVGAVGGALLGRIRSPGRTRGPPILPRRRRIDAASRRHERAHSRVPIRVHMLGAFAPVRPA